MMRWTLAACCGLALIHLSVALQIRQKPRFCGVTTSRSVIIYCQSSPEDLSHTAQWYKANNIKPDNKVAMVAGERIKFTHSINKTRNNVLILLDLRVEDSGVYFCQIGRIWGPGTELHVGRPIVRVQAVYRSQMKDALMILQGLLLAVCIAAIVMRKQKLLERRDSIYEEPETDHIYEGLAIESCGGDLYEDLAVYTEADGTEAPWQ